MYKASSDSLRTVFFHGMYFSNTIIRGSSAFSIASVTIDLALMLALAEAINRVKRRDANSTASSKPASKSLSSCQARIKHGNCSAKANAFSPFTITTIICINCRYQASINSIGDLLIAITYF